MSVHALLTGVRDALALLEGVQTCRIGIEPDISAVDYPIVRLVPSVLRRSDTTPRDVVDLLVYYGELSHAFEAGGIQAQYEWLLIMEGRIRLALIQGAKHPDGWRADWQETVLDEDRLPGYKLFASRFLLSPLR